MTSVPVCQCACERVCFLMSRNTGGHVLPSANRCPLEKMWNLRHRTGETESEGTRNTHTSKYRQTHTHSRLLRSNLLKRFRNSRRQQCLNTRAELFCQQLHNCIHMQILKRKRADFFFFYKIFSSYKTQGLQNCLGA